jgi:hypothetical protein
MMISVCLLFCIRRDELAADSELVSSHHANISVIPRTVLIQSPADLGNCIERRGGAKAFSRTSPATPLETDTQNTRGLKARSIPRSHLARTGLSALSLMVVHETSDVATGWHESQLSRSGPHQSSGTLAWSPCKSK